MTLIERARSMAFDLREASKDWNGQFQPDGADPIHPVTCVELRDLARLIDNLASAVVAERERCAGIVSAARFNGNTDLRSIIHAINDPTVATSNMTEDGG